MAKVFWKKKFNFSDRVELSGDVTRILKLNINQIKVDPWLTSGGWWGEIEAQGEKKREQETAADYRERHTGLTQYGPTELQQWKKKEQYTNLWTSATKPKANSKLLKVKKGTEYRVKHHNLTREIMDTNLATQRKTDSQHYQLENTECFTAAGTMAEEPK